MTAVSNAKDEKAASRRDRRRQTTQGVVSFALVDGEQLKYTLAAVAQEGGALRLGYTRDGGAFAVGIYGDGEPYTDYVNPHEDINAYLRDLAEDFGNVTGDGSIRTAAPAADRKRKAR